MRYKLALRFVIEGDLRFISHHDTLRLFERALARARWPVRFSEGFNPRARLSLPLPRPVGIASDAEVLVVELSEPTEPSACLRRLAQQMPDGLTLCEAWTLDERETLRPEVAVYSIALPPERVNAVTEAVSRLLAAPQWCMERRGPGTERSRTIDLRAFLTEAGIHEGALRWAMRVTDAGTARPGEFLAAVGLEPQECQHGVRRLSVRWRSPGFPAPTCPT